MIEKLTKEQQDRFSEFVKKWTDIGLSTEKANRKEAEEGIKEAYAIAGLKEPKIVWCDSPFSQGITRMIVQKLESEEKLQKGTIGKSEDASVGASVGDSVRDSVRDSVWDSVRDSVRDSVGDSVRDSVEASVRDSVGDSVWASVWDSVGDSVWDSVRDSVRNSVRDSVEASVRDSVGDSVWASVWDSVGNSVRASVGNSVRASVWASVGTSVRDSGFGQHDANWLAFYDFFNEVCKLEQETNKLSGLWKIAKNAGWFLPHQNICWVSERHTELHRNAQGRLHNTRGMALKYPDGWGIYALNGVRFPEELFKKITSENVSAKDILSIQDIDQRTQAMRFLPPVEMVKELKGEALDSYTKIAVDGSEIHYTLYKFPKGEVFIQDAYYCLFDCPSTGKQHLEGMEVSKTVPEAMSWAEEITEDEWKARIPLLHEV